MSSLAAGVALSNGVSLPSVGLGVYLARRGDETRAAVAEALRLGYRHIDTARAYGNEKDVGAAVRDSGVPRAEVFVTTKLWNDDQGYDSALRAFDAAGMLQTARLAAPGEADTAIRDLFADDGIAYIHAHNAAYGCFAARIERDAA